MYGVVVIKRALGIEVALKTANNGDQFFLPDNQIIRGQRIRVYGIEAFCVEQLTKTPGALTMETLNGCLGLMLNFVDAGNSNRVYQIPFFTFISSENGGFIREFEPFEIVLTKSFVSVADGTNITAGNGVYFSLIYAQI